MIKLVDLDEEKEMEDLDKVIVVKDDLEYIIVVIRGQKRILYLFFFFVYLYEFVSYIRDLMLLIYDLCYLIIYYKNLFYFFF